MLDAALHSISTGKLDDAEEVLELGARRASARRSASCADLSFALEPVVLRDQGFGPALRALADADRHLERDPRRPRRRRRGARRRRRRRSRCTRSIRELLDQAIRRGPPTRIEVGDRTRSPTAASRPSIWRRCGARTPAALVRGDRGAREAAPRRRSKSSAARAGTRDHRDAAALRDPALGFRAVAAATSSSSGRRPATRCASWKATRRRSATELRGRRPHAGREQDRRLAAPGRRPRAARSPSARC